MTYKNCVKQITEELSSLPPDWAEKLACNICSVITTEDECSLPEQDCTDIRNCQTLTSLSTFDVQGDTICISFTDENDVVVRRCFQFIHLNTINNTDGSCLNPLWGTLTETEKWQAIIDKICLCCNPTTTTTTTSTTSTTTIAPCTDCNTMTMYNPTGSTHSFTYKDCSNGSHTQAVTAGSTFRFCGCPSNVTYNHAQFVLTIIDFDGCVSTPTCNTCNQYVIANSNPFPVEVFYTACGTLLPASVWALPAIKTVISCACTGSVILTSGISIAQTLDCPNATTTTTTTVTPCECSRVVNPGGPDRIIAYTDCDGNVQATPIAALQTYYICSQSGTLTAFGCTITNMGYCFDGCNPGITSTTTTTTATPCIQYTIIGPDDLGTFAWSYLNCAGHLVSGTIGPDETICVTALTGSITGDAGVTWEVGC